MADNEGKIDALEHQFMRAWLSGERKQLRNLVSRRFRLVVGAAQPVLLDRKSLLEAVGDRWPLHQYRVGATYARLADGVGIFAAALELDMSIDGQSFTGSWWVTDLWRKSGISRRWQLTERQMTQLESETRLPQAVRALQLWR